MGKRSVAFVVSAVLAAGMAVGGAGPAWRAPAAWALPDPGALGPLAVSIDSFSYGDTTFQPSGFPGPVELKASVHYPTDLSRGPFPLVVVLHGRHATCHLGGSSFLEWPCGPGRSEIPSYQGYDYVSSVLASHGYVVTSIGANGINARDNSTADLGMSARAQLVQRHLDQWKTFTTTGAAPFGSRFVGKVDLDNVGTMGHSRGGEGVVRHYLLNKSKSSPYGVQAVFPLAPVDFARPVINNVPLQVLLPYCDGDVSDLQGIHFYDDARYNVPGDTAPKHSVLVRGANHNFYNTIWTPGGFPAGTSDDWNAFVSGGTSDPHCGTGSSSKRLTAAQQRGTLTAYLTAFFRVYLGGETVFRPYLTGAEGAPASAGTDDVFLTYHPADTPTTRRDLSRLTTASELTTNTLGGKVVQKNLTPYDLCGGESPQPQHCLAGQSSARQPHTTPSHLSPKRGLSQLRTGWSRGGAKLKHRIPASAADVSGFEAFQFRAAVNFADGRNPAGAASDAVVTIKDTAGKGRSMRVGRVSDALYYPPGNTGPVPHAILNTVRIPLSAFTGVDLRNVKLVLLKFTKRPSGAVLVTDLAFTD